MEFLRFGSRISGSGIGCCAFDVIQGFDSDPDAKASIQLIDGDGAMPVCDYKTNEQLYAGTTNKDIFLTRLRIGTFSKKNLPNHGFLAVITENQLNYPTGKAWLKILKENGFEFVRAVDNSVYSSCRKNYLFALFRNVEDRGLDPDAPPKEWEELQSVHKTQKEIWDALGEPKLLTEKQLREAGVTPYLAGTRGDFPKVKPVEKKEEKNTKTPWAKKNEAFTLAKVPM